MAEGEIQVSIMVNYPEVTLTKVNNFRWYSTIIDRNFKVLKFSLYQKFKIIKIIYQDRIQVLMLEPNTALEITDTSKVFVKCL